MNRPLWIIILSMAYWSCHQKAQHELVDISNNKSDLNGIQLIVLGTIQDAGSPQIGCQKKCCAHLWKNPDPTRQITSLGVIDHQTKNTYLLEASPDIVSQIDLLMDHAHNDRTLPEAIYLTHAHIGHYTGLMQLGKEAINADQVAVKCMPKMANFLSNNGPWDQLVNTQNIKIEVLVPDTMYRLSPDLAIQPLLVPHRGEYSETVGYKILGPNKSAVFIPDIDKWHLWETDITKVVKDVDYAFLDATFYDGEELGGRDMSLIPHPTVEESMSLFDTLSLENKSKVHFIHFNHTNPLLDKSSAQYSQVATKGYQVAQYGQSFSL